MPVYIVEERQRRRCPRGARNAALMDLESALFKLMSCADSKEGMRAVLEKREPQWQDE